MPQLSAPPVIDYLHKVDPPRRVHPWGGLYGRAVVLDAKDGTFAWGEV
jgi:hypothetical protein